MYRAKAGHLHGGYVLVSHLKVLRLSTVPPYFHILFGLQVARLRAGCLPCTGLIDCPRHGGAERTNRNSCLQEA